MKKKKYTRRKAVIATNKYTGEELRFDSMTEAGDAFGVRCCSVSQACVIGFCLKGYYWRKEEDDA